jgi:tetratricopeptide (TPR) repeat protein
MKPSKTWMIPAALALTAVLRLTAATGFMHSPLLLHPVLEDLDYRSRAVQIHEDPSAGRTLPRGSALYPLLAGSIPGVADGGTRPLAMAQCACEVATALFLALLVRRRWGRTAAAAAVTLYALDPLGAFFAARFSPVVPATLAFVAAVYLWDRERSREAPSLPLGLGTGLVAALGFLLVPLPFVFLLGLRLRERILAAHRVGGRLAWGTAILPCVFAAAFAAVLLTQNTRLPAGGPVLSWGAGPAIDHAFDPATGGTPRFLRPPSWIADDELRRRTWEDLGRQGTEMDIYRVTASRGWSRALKNPLSTIGVLLSKATATVSAWPVPDALSASFLAARTAKPFTGLAWSFAGLLALGAAGFLLLRGDPLRDTLAQGLLAVALASLLGLASAASRQAGLPLLAALGGGWIAGAAGRAADRFRRASLTALGIALVASVGAGLLGPARPLRNPSEDLRLLAAAFEQTMSWRQAVPILEEAVKRDPRNLEARVELAQAYIKDALPAAATEQLETAYRADSTNANVVAALAARRSASGRPEEALALMQRLVEQHPRNAAFLRDYGTWLGQAGRMPEAEVALTQAVRLDPTDEAATRSLQETVNIRMSMENSLFPDELRTEGDAEYGAAVPRIVDAMEQGRWGQADSLLSWAERSHGQLATTHWVRAGYCARRGDIRGAIAALERCQRIAPGRPAVVVQLTRLYLESGQSAKLLPLFRESLAAAGPDSVVVRQLKLLAREIRLPLN